MAKGKYSEFSSRQSCEKTAEDKPEHKQPCDPKKGEKERKRGKKERKKWRERGQRAKKECVLKAKEQGRSAV